MHLLRTHAQAAKGQLSYIGETASHISGRLDKPDARRTAGLRSSLYNRTASFTALAARPALLPRSGFSTFWCNS
jgi:hypothetical protein